MKVENKKYLEEMRNTAYGKALIEFLTEKEDELENVRYCTSWEDTLARQKALKIIDELFQFMKEKVEVSNKTRYD